MSVLGVAFFQFILCLAAMGAFIAMMIILLLALIEGGQALGARQWASTNGAIVDVHIASERDDHDPKQVKMLYRPTVSYTYFVKGKQFVGNRIHFGAPSKYGEKGPAEKAAALYSAGAPTTVFYDPEAPDSAVLKRESPAAGRLGKIALAVIGGGVLALVVAVAINSLAV